MCPAPTKQFFNSNSDIKGADNEIAQAVSGIFAGFAAQAKQYDYPHILVGHWNVSGAMVSETQVLTGVDVEISKDQMGLAEANLICLGHIHKSQQIGNNIFFSGSTQNNTWGEMSEPGFYMHELDSKNSLTSRFIPTPSQKRFRIQKDYTEEELDIDNFLKDCLSILPNTVIRCDIKVYQDEALTLDTEKIKDHFIGAGCDNAEINIIRIPRENTRSKTILALEKLRDKIVERAGLNHETVPESILTKADMLERELPENIVRNLC
jgi:DNA repair exonuclease SbcCD nuclease subunit